MAATTAPAMMPRKTTTPTAMPTYMPVLLTETVSSCTPLMLVAGEEDAVTAGCVTRLVLAMGRGELDSFPGTTIIDIDGGFCVRCCCCVWNVVSTLWTCS